MCPAVPALLVSSVPEGLGDQTPLSTVKFLAKGASWQGDSQGITGLWDVPWHKQPSQVPPIWVASVSLPTHGKTTPTQMTPSSFWIAGTAVR